MIAELDGPFWLASSDRGLRERVGERAERSSAAARSCASWRGGDAETRSWGSPSRSRASSSSGSELAVSPEFRRVTTTVHLRGGGEEGLGEDVTYQADLHDTFPCRRSPAAGRSRRSPSRSRASRSSRPSSRGQRRIRLPALGVGERRARPRAAPGGDDARATSSGASAQPVTYVVSTRVEKVPRVLELYPQMHFKLDPGPDWERRDDRPARGARRRRHGGLQGRLPRRLRPAAEPGALHADRGGVPERVARGSRARRRDGRGAAPAPRSGSRGMRRSTRSPTWRRCRFRRAA